MNRNTWTCRDVCVTPDMCERVHWKLRMSARGRVCVCLCACVCVRIKKVIWELRGNVNCSCNTDSALADSPKYGSAARECVFVCVFTWSCANVKHRLTKL